MIFPKEKWVDVNGYEGLYKVSNIGRVKSLERTVSKNKILKEKIMKFKICKDGYKRVNLSKNGIKTNYFVHKLVADAFLNKADFKSMLYECKNDIDINKLQVNHIDDTESGRLDNSVFNLEWCTQVYNLSYKYRNKWKEDRTEIGKDISHCKLVEQYTMDGELIKIQTTEEWYWEGYNKGSISQACNNKYNNKCNDKYGKDVYRGFKWRYVE